MYAVCLTAIVILALMSSLMQSTLLGLAGSMGPKISAAVMFGQGASGLLAFGLSLLIELILGSDAESGVGPVTQAAALFVFSFAYTLASMWLYHGCFSCRIPDVVEALASLERERSSTRLGGARDLRCVPSGQTAQQLHLANVPLRESSAGPDSAHHVTLVGSNSSWERLTPVLRKIAAQAFNVWLVFVVTMVVFPGVMIKWTPGRGLFIKLLVGTFQVFDVSGRYLAGMLTNKLPPERLWIIVALRLFFVPAFILGQRSSGSSFIWGSDFGRVLLVMLLSLSNGFAASCAMIFGPGLVDVKDRELAGIAMSSTMVVGIFCGTLLALLTQL